MNAQDRSTLEHTEVAITSPYEQDVSLLVILILPMLVGFLTTVLVSAAISWIKKRVISRAKPD